MDEFNKRIAVLQEWQDNWEQRIEAFMSEHADHFWHLRKRANNMHLHKGEITIEDFQDIQKFLTFLGVKDANTEEEKAEQRFALSAFNQYQSFVDESRELSKQRNELRLQLQKNMVAFLSALIVPLDDLIQLENNLKEDEAYLVPEIRKLMQDRQIFNNETEREILHIQESIALNELKIKALQKETMN